MLTKRWTWWRTLDKNRIWMNWNDLNLVERLKCQCKHKIRILVFTHQTVWITLMDIVRLSIERRIKGFEIQTEPSFSTAELYRPRHSHLHASALKLETKRNAFVANLRPLLHSTLKRWRCANLQAFLIMFMSLKTCTQLFYCSRW